MQKRLCLHSPNSKKSENSSLIPTSDGSFTLHSTYYDECYHSTTSGAITETLHTHIIPAFDFHKNKDSLKILDICFGLGYNTFVSIIEAKKRGVKKIEILSPEMDKNLLNSLKTFLYDEYFKDIKHIIKSLLNEHIYEEKGLKVAIYPIDARIYLTNSHESFDIVYQDAFSPKKNPSLWTKEYFDDIFRLTSDDVIITTYSQATAIRLSLYEAGFEVYENTQNKGLKNGTLAFKKSQVAFKKIDLELKKMRNKEAKALYDKDELS